VLNVCIIGLEAMMKRLVLVGTLIGALAGSGAFAQTTEPAKKARTGAKAADQGAGHTAPKPQPGTEAAPAAPEGQVQLGSVRLTKAVKADGKSLPAGTYQVRVTPQTASPAAKGQTTALERWVEFVQGGQVKGREVVTIIPQADISKVQKDAPPRPNGSKVETLKGGDYMRLWINKGGNHYLVHFPV
jgi:hypothetical protein